MADDPGGAGGWVNVREEIMSETFIRFEKLQEVGDRKTSKWIVKTVAAGDILGIVKWHGPWRMYVFYPSSSTLFSASCMIDITNFIRERMKERKDGDLL